MSRGDWLHEQLFERRIVLVSGRLDDGVAARAAAALLALDAGGSRPIELHLSSPDGELGAALVLIDTADALRSALAFIAGVKWAGRSWPWSRPRITAPPRRMRASTSPSRRRGSPAPRRRSPRRVVSSRSCCGSSTGASPGAPAAPPRRSQRICGAGVTSPRGKRSTTASLTRSRATGSGARTLAQGRARQPRASFAKRLDPVFSLHPTLYSHVSAAGAGAPPRASVHPQRSRSNERAQHLDER